MKCKKLIALKLFSRFMIDFSQAMREMMKKTNLISTTIKVTMGHQMGLQQYSSPANFETT